MFNPSSFPAKIGIFAVIDYKKQKNVTNEPATFSFFYNYVTFFRFLQTDFIDDAGEAGVAVYGPKDETDVYAYAFVVARRAVYVACERLLVAVKREAYQFTFRVHDRTS